MAQRSAYPPQGPDSCCFGKASTSTWLSRTDESIERHIFHGSSSELTLNQFNGVAQAVSSYESYLEVKALDSNGEVDPWALSISESAASNTAQVDQVSTEGLTSGNNFAACAAYGQLEIYNYFDNHDTTTIFGTQCGPIKLAVVNVQQLQH